MKKSIFVGVIGGFLPLLSLPLPAGAVGLGDSASAATTNPATTNAATAELQPQSAPVISPALGLAATTPAQDAKPLTTAPVVAQSLPAPSLPAAPAKLPEGLSPIPSAVQPLRSQTSVQQLESEAPLPSSSGNNRRSINQVTSVTQLSDVKPTDWAFQALQSLVERYGCIAGYPNGTFRGNRAATRFELAAALNSCLDVISDRFATKEDLQTVRQLQVEFAKELAALKGRVTNLEARTTLLESRQFSTTTKLAGEAIFQGTQFGGGNLPIPAGTEAARDLGFFNRGRIAENFFVTGRSTLNLLTSFSGKDLLITSLQAGNYPANFTGTAGFPASLAPQVTQVQNQNQFGLYALQYRFPLFNDRVNFIATAAGGELSDFADTLNPLDSDGQGSLSAFGLRNPIYRQITRFGGTQFGGAGGGATFNITDKISFGVGYLAPLYSAANPISQTTGRGGGGLFSGDFAAIAQVTYKPLKTLGFGLTYVRSYTRTPFNGIAFGGLTGSTRANTAFSTSGLFDRGGGISDLDTVPTSANSAGFQFSWQAVKRVTLSGWVGATFATAEANSSPGSLNQDNQGNLININRGATATILNYALTVAVTDVFREGNTLGFVFGSQPWVVSSSIRDNTDPNLNFHLEAFYRYRVNDNISITPGVFAVINPEGNSLNPTVFVGTIRTTFTF